LLIQNFAHKERTISSNEAVTVISYSRYSEHSGNVKALREKVKSRCF
jgi:hypothetical protein